MTQSKKGNLWTSMLLSSVFPMMLGLTLSNQFPDWRWSNYPFHAMVESVGSVSALIIATLIIIMVNNNNLSRRFIMVACALIGMGLLDGFHAILLAGVSFVWLHSIATLIGGFLFSLVWFSESWLTPHRQKVLIYSTIIVSLISGVISIALPEILPAMIVEKQFSFLAKMINITGGIGFLIGTAYFIHTYYTKKKTSVELEASHNENAVFANHCLLFGIAGLLFETSVLWDGGWWWWHILRFLAYFVVLVYFFSLFNKSQNQLKLNKFKLEKLNQDLEKRVLKRTIELEKASQAKSDFLSAMSHELRTPMNAILGFGQLLELDSESLDETQKSHIKEISIAGLHLLDLINEVLDLSKIEAGEMDLKMENVSIDNVLQECIKMLDTAAAKRQVRIIDKISSNGYIVKADHKRLKQVLLNLLSNAIKYNNERGLITIHSETIRPKSLRISVTDTGLGLTDDEIDRLFTPFDRLNIESNIEGTGIGLVICQHMVKAMNGKIGIVSVKGKGSTFWVELSLASNNQ